MTSRYKYKYEPETGKLTGPNGEKLKMHRGSRGHKNINHDGKSVAVHRIIMEIMGHDIDGKDVHHKNENKNDNRYSNLQVMTRAEHMRWHEERRISDLAMVPAKRRTLVRSEGGSFVHSMDSGRNRSITGGFLVHPDDVK